MENTKQSLHMAYDIKAFINTRAQVTHMKKWQVL